MWWQKQLPGVGSKSSSPINCFTNGITKTNACPKEEEERRRFDDGTYRVSIKSFPDYKHLLQENYVE
jgi:hypothetical protein